MTGIIECLLFSGSVLGWSSLVYIYKLEGYFDEECQDALGYENASYNQNHSICEAPILQKCAIQDEKFSQIYVLAGSAINVGCLLTGYLMDRFGTGVGIRVGRPGIGMGI